ncbi:hypothetical protein [Streptomyces coffeae]|uniref:Uncharacterized protein n=1 Tax=Streptomyces coffeae TaxID=621382 RepID=A0ABS1NNK9_9ACTN|nr:hypothetical protein [Streptomyces coffeae]MBL1101534.1 hypothetical protein [Streptomyces coffeae]
MADRTLDDEVQQYFAGHPTTPITKAKIGGILTSVQAVQRRVGPADLSRLLQRDERVRLYQIDQVLVERNKSTNRLIEWRGGSRVLADWAELTGMSESTIRRRLFYPGLGGHCGLPHAAWFPSHPETRSMPVRPVVGSCHNDR